MEQLRNLPLFAGMTDGEIERQIEALRGQRGRVEKGSVLIRQGERVDRFGILLEGRLQGHQVDADGSLSVVSTLGVGMMFGEILIFSDCPAPVTLVALTDCRILWLGPMDLSRTHPTLIGNLLSTIAGEYWALHQKIAYCGIVSLRKRIFAFLSDRSGAVGVPFTVPFDRNGMAAYLNADRSALSRELSRMRDEGILDYHKNRFTLFVSAL